VIQEISSNHGQITQTGDVIICQGGASCRLTKPGPVDSAKAENEFYRETGIRAGSHAQSLLVEFRERHRLTWRGFGVALLWRHRCLDYDASKGELRLNPSMASVAWGSVVLVCAIVIILSLVGTMASGTKMVTTDDYVLAIAAIAVYVFAFWVAVLHMIAPELIARRLLEREQRQQTPVRRSQQAVPVGM